MITIQSRFAALLFVACLFSCQQERSPITGWAYNDPTNGGFEKMPYEEQETGPGLVLIEGGSFTMGRTEQDVTYEWNNVPRRVTVCSFYMDETEVSNFSYLEYLYWTNRIFATDFPEIYYLALPDTLVWREKLAYNEPMVDYYLRHPSYRDYPVVGINWLQANDFCSWRTDRVNEMILIREGLLDHNPQPSSTDYFCTDTYLSGAWQGQLKSKMPSSDPNADGQREIRMEDGIFLPKYRLPTEAEWEFAAYGLIGNTIDERVTERRLYPWNGHGTRNASDDYLGQMNANFVRGNGDFMGVSGALNDNADITAPVYSYWPNDFGLYNMAGNVSEWTMDVYRPNTLQDADEFRPFRGNVFRTQVRDETSYAGNVPELFVKNTDTTSADSTKPWLGGTILANDGTPIVQKYSQISINHNSAKGGANDTITLQAKFFTIPDGMTDIPGRIKWREVSSAVAADNLDERRNYKMSNYINYMDGDLMSSIYYNNEDVIGDYQNKANTLMYEYGKTSLINDKSRVIKGGSWRDRAYFLNPGVRRYLDQRQSNAWLGFRCAMTRVGSPKGMGGK